MGSAPTEAYCVERATLNPVSAPGGLLDRTHLKELCRLAIGIESLRGCPQDIEFAFTDGGIHILQARPLTAFRHVSPEILPDLDKPSLVDVSMRPLAAERYAIAPRPLDNIIFVRVDGAVIYAIRKLGGRISADDEHEFRAQIWSQAYRLPRVRLMPALLLAPWKYMSLLRLDWQAWWNSGPRMELRAACREIDVAGLNDLELFECCDRILAVWEKALNERFYASSAINAQIWLDRIVRLAVGRRHCTQIVADLMSIPRTPTSEVNEVRHPGGHACPRRNRSPAERPRSHRGRRTGIGPVRLLT